MSVASDVERQMLDLINDDRAEVGAPPLTLELNLNDSAETHSEWMLDADQFSHTGEGGSSPGDRMAAADFDFSGSWSWGENIAWQSERGAEGIADDVAQLHQSLMDSPEHRANILNPDFEYVGIGVEQGDLDGSNAVIVSQNFAMTDGAVDPDTGGGDTPTDGGGTDEPVDVVDTGGTGDDPTTPGTGGSDEPTGTPETGGTDDDPSEPDDGGSGDDPSEPEDGGSDGDPTGTPETGGSDDDPSEPEDGGSDDDPGEPEDGGSDDDPGEPEDGGSDDDPSEPEDGGSDDEPTGTADDDGSGDQPTEITDGDTHRWGDGGFLSRIWGHWGDRFDGLREGRHFDGDRFAFRDGGQGDHGGHHLDDVEVDDAVTGLLSGDAVSDLSAFFDDAAGDAPADLPVGDIEDCGGWADAQFAQITDDTFGLG